MMSAPAENEVVTGTGSPVALQVFADAGAAEPTSTDKRTAKRIGPPQAAAPEQGGRHHGSSENQRDSEFLLGKNCGAVKQMRAVSPLSGSAMTSGRAPRRCS